jgi:hypothetical protein
MSQDEIYLVKLKRAGMTDAFISKRMGIPIPQVESMWEKIKRDAMVSLSNGYPDLIAQFTILAHQYELMGENLKILGTYLSQIIPASEIADLLEGKPEEVLERLRLNCIILRPFVLPPPSVPDTQNVAGN